MYVLVRLGYFCLTRLHECRFCAHLYEKHKEMAAAALAYKCMEVANMKVVFYKDSGASKDRNELHAALQLVPTGNKLGIVHRMASLLMNRHLFYSFGLFCGKKFLVSFSVLV